jgi:hypothetical protein
VRDNRLKKSQLERPRLVRIRAEQFADELSMNRERVFSWSAVSVSSEGTREGAWMAH